MRLIYYLGDSLNAVAAATVKAEAVLFYMSDFLPVVREEKEVVPLCSGACGLQKGGPLWRRQHLLSLMFGFLMAMKLKIMFYLCDSGIYSPIFFPPLVLCIFSRIQHT